ncbi:Transmembrane prolyl 4-hydroxylase [Holothuria leucospilota]|uniref:Transmembrane prolyl 4-hydroxylase n=1 Tax=Holothuria leucospilota TaxID=206669 RepID=A0A9Q1C811_HOLLE|nr:Transmembrane prolyl 4-hydroxylase [Holothuria leucospilota]
MAFHSLSTWSQTVLSCLLLLAAAITTLQEDLEGGTKHLYQNANSDKEDDICVSKDDGQCTKFKRLLRLEGHEVGHIQEVEIQDGKKHLMKTFNMKPLIFEIPDFFTEEECDRIIELAEVQGLQSSVTHNHDRSSGIRLLDRDGDRKLSLTEMRRTIEEGFDLYLVEEDLKKLYSELDLDVNQDGFISKDEMQRVSVPQMKAYLLNLIKEKPVKKSRMSSQTWIYPDRTNDPLVESFQQRISRLTQLPDIMINSNSYFQVVRYGKEGHYNAHHDSGDNFNYPCCHTVEHKKCEICRYATIMVYLNNVEEGGETAFPVANNETYDEEIFRNSGIMNLNQYCKHANLKLFPKKGTAVLWYNHFINETTGWMGSVDKFTWHGGCPVIKGEKWIMNRWIAASPDPKKDLGYS